MYTQSKYQFTRTTELENFKLIDDEVSMGFHPRHGTVVPIAAKEADLSMAKWGTPKL